MLRAERHIITRNHELFKSIDEQAFKCKNLYNYANYLIRQEFINNKRWIRYNELVNLCKNDECFKEVGYTAIAQQVLRLLDKNWVSFFKAIKEYKKHPEKFKGCPKLPNYKHKTTGRSIIIMAIPPKEKNNTIVLPKILGSYNLKTKLVGKIHQLRIVPCNGYYVIEIIKDVEVHPKKSANGRYLGIDIGVNNLATVVNNCGLKPFIANGRGLKSINQYWNNKISKYQILVKKVNGKDDSRRIDRMWLKRRNQINDYMHKTSRFIVNYCVRNGINTIVIGHNNCWKQDVSMKKKDRTTFVQIPFNNLINQIQYKGEELGLTVIVTEESYTSQSSFLNLDPLPVYGKEKGKIEFSGYRIKRGLYKIKGTDIKINADVNGAYNIIRKVISVEKAFPDSVFPKVFNEGTSVKNTRGISGIAVCPVKINFN